MNLVTIIWIDNNACVRNNVIAAQIRYKTLNAFEQTTWKARDAARERLTQRSLIITQIMTLSVAVSSKTPVLFSRTATENRTKKAWAGMKEMYSLIAPNATPLACH